ncbi:MAG: M1 family metallopeptidase [Candidatus Saccharimonadales bacterium]
MTKTVRRFYSELKPSHYELELAPDTTNFTFTGRATIYLTKTGRPSQRFTFHQYDLKIEKAQIIKHDKKDSHELEVRRINNQNKLNEVRLHTSEMIYSGNYEVRLTFKGKITRGMSGLYPCFFNYKGKEHTLLATQFESHYAREVFPCIDEPEAKATFQLKLITPKGLSLLSNTPIESQEEGPKSLVTTTFATTPRMSTYLLAFVIGELHSSSTKTKRGTEVSVWATLSQPKTALQFGLDVAKRSIEFFEDYFSIDYPLAKADHVALPDFSSGAMENWGLITYRERALLANPDKSSQLTRELIATVIAHETSHQWFGNLVTMRWWNDLWLNESFANLMEYQAVDSLFPDWHIWDTFIMNEGLAALRRDATPGVQAVKTDVGHPDEISTLFDGAIVYAKGGRLLCMLKTYIGESAFRQGLTNYFKQHAYENTTGNDLWLALSKSSGLDVAVFMNPWLEQSGFPMVSVDNDNASVTLEQVHFLDNGVVSDGRLWSLPLFSNRQELPDRLDKARLYRNLSPNQLPLLINQGSFGHYIVNYKQPAHRAQVIKLVRQKALGTADRLMILNEASMLAKAGQQTFGEVLKLLAAYQDESSEIVWNMMALIIGESRRFIDRDENLEASIKKFLQNLIGDEYTRLGWDEKTGESLSDRKLRSTIIDLGAYAEEPDIISQALERFSQYTQNPDSLSAELRSIVFGVAVKKKKNNAFASLLESYDTTADSELKSDITASLTLTRSQRETQILLNRLKKASLIKPQDAEYWLIYLLGNRYVRDLAWQWLTENWQWIEKTYSREKSYDDYPRYAATICNTEEWAKKYITFFKPKRSDIALERNIDIGLAEIDSRLKWLDRDLSSVQTFFKEQPQLKKARLIKIKPL